MKNWEGGCSCGWGQGLEVHSWTGGFLCSGGDARLRVGGEEGQIPDAKWSHWVGPFPGGAGEPQEGCEQGMVVDRDIRGMRMEGKAGARAWGQEERGAPICGLVRVRPLPEEEMGNLGGVG